MTRQRPDASWVGPPRDSRPKTASPLARLIAPQQGLPAPKPRTGVVATPQNLPSMIPYGHVPPGQAQSSTFTGGVARNPLNLTQGETTSFTAPIYAALAALAGLSPGGAGRAGSALGPSSGPGISGPNPPPPAPPGSYGPAGQAFISQYGTAPSVYLPQQTSIGHSGAAPIAQVTPPPSLAAALASGGKRRVYQV